MTVMQWSVKARDVQQKLKTAGSRRRASNIVATEFKDRVAELAGQLARGEIDILKWQIEMRQTLRETWTMQLVVGAGGDKSKIGSDEYLKLGTRLKQQYEYLEKFAADITSKRLSEPQIAVRAKMYIDASKMIYWQQITGVELPAYPGDGSTRCLVNCKCSWRIQYVKDANGVVLYALATWVLGKAEHCEDCVTRASKWVRMKVRVDNSKLSTAFKQRVGTKAIRLRLTA